MNYTNRKNLRLLARNEGKIKSYESCSDVRAWSHDSRVRDCYLREWIKCDMPIRFLSASTLANFLRIMTYRSRGRITPRCHPDCKSKILLESICNSCHAMKECLKNDENYEKYFEEEEFETSHWPCERCLEALKSIKMFWKILVEKLFNISVPKNEEFENAKCNRADSVRSVVKVWQKEMVQQALFVKNVTPLLRRTPNPFRNSSPTNETKFVKKESTSGYLKSYKLEDKKDTLNISTARSASPFINSLKTKTTDTDYLSNANVNRTQARRLCRKLSRYTSVRVKMIDFGCNTCNEEEENEAIKLYKTNLQYLQQQYNIQNNETERLKRDNTSLRIELQNVYKTIPWRTSFSSPTALNNDQHTITLVPKPFETCEEENSKNQIKNIDSEMIITMKNCKNESFRHVSVLQVLHKTNEPITKSLNEHKPCCKKEDPIDLLTKVQNTFGEIVRREISMVNERKSRARKVDIEATFHSVNTSRSAPSCSTISSFAPSSQSNFVSTKDVSD